MPDNDMTHMKITRDYGIGRRLSLFARTLLFVWATAELLRLGPDH